MIIPQAAKVLSGEKTIHAYKQFGQTARWGESKTIEALYHPSGRIMFEVGRIYKVSKANYLPVVCKVKILTINVVDVRTHLDHDAFLRAYGYPNDPDGFIYEWARRYDERAYAYCQTKFKSPDLDYWMKRNYVSYIAWVLIFEVVQDG